MKKALSVAIVLAMLSTLFLCFTTGAQAAAVTQTGPDWLITEICMDQQGDGTGGYSDNKDVFEFLEIYNNSGMELNLYDYCLIYNGNKRTDPKFETVVVESTPIKAGDYFDGSDPASVDTLSVENKGANPDTCLVAPGEIVVLWIRFYESYLKTWNDGKGMSLADFRTFYGIPESTKVIMVDGNSNTDNGGNDKNFNLKNSATGTYGIAKNTDNMKAANVAGGTYQVNWTECPDITSWITVEFGPVVASSIANTSWTYTINKEETDMRRLTNLQWATTPTPGYLDTESICSLYATYLRSGQEVKLSSEDFQFLEEDDEVKGYNIDGEFHEGKEYTFTVPADGLYNIKAVIEKKPVESETPKESESETEPGTPANSESTEPGSDEHPSESKEETKEPGSNTQGVETSAPKENGCKSAVISTAAVVVMACAAAAALKKRK